MVENKGIGQ